MDKVYVLLLKTIVFDTTYKNIVGIASTEEDKIKLVSANLSRNSNPIKINGNYDPTCIEVYTLDNVDNSELEVHHVDLNKAMYL